MINYSRQLRKVRRIATNHAAFLFFHSPNLKNSFSTWHQCSELMKRYERSPATSADLIAPMMAEVYLLRQICCHPQLSVMSADVRELLSIEQVLGQRVVDQSNEACC